jgi:hypothetical protein
MRRTKKRNCTLVVIWPLESVVPILLPDYTPSRPQTAFPLPACFALSRIGCWQDPAVKSSRLGIVMGCWLSAMDSIAIW